jgi:hypothetical protein
MSFRESMLTDDRMRVLVDYLTATDVFAGIGLKGGVCYFLWDRDNRGDCRVSTHFGDWPVTTTNRRLLEEGADVFIRFNEGSLGPKEGHASRKRQFNLPELARRKALRPIGQFEKALWAGHTFRGKSTQSDGDLLVYRNGGIGYTPRSSIRLGANLIDKWKVFVGRAGPGTGNKDTYPHKIISTPFIGEPGSVSSETYLCIGPFDRKPSGKCVVISLLSPDALPHSLAQARSRHNAKGLHLRSEQEVDQEVDGQRSLYERMALSETEIAFVEKIVRPMDLTGGARLGEVVPDVDDDE